MLMGEEHQLMPGEVTLEIPKAGVVATSDFTFEDEAKIEPRVTCSAPFWPS